MLVGSGIGWNNSRGRGVGDKRKEARSNASGKMTKMSRVRLWSRAANLQWYQRAAPQLWAAVGGQCGAELVRLIQPVASVV